MSYFKERDLLIHLPDSSLLIANKEPRPTALYLTTTRGYNADTIRSLVTGHRHGNTICVKHGSWDTFDDACVQFIQSHIADVVLDTNKVNETITIHAGAKVGAINTCWERGPIVMTATLLEDGTIDFRQTPDTPLALRQWIEKRA